MMVQIEKHILKILKRDRPEVAFESSDNLVEDGLLDSFDIVMLTTELEKEFHIDFPGDEILPETFASLNSIAKVVKRLKSV